MPLSFRNAVDICNRGLDHCGASLISNTEGFNEDSKNAQRCSIVYDKLRRAELRRNIWRFSIRHAAIRPVDSTTMIVKPALWSSATTYLQGALVTDETGTIWISTAPNNLNNAPGNSFAWETYFGPLTVTPWDSAQTYYAGELVYLAPGDGTFQVFFSRQNRNSDNPATPTVYDATVTYSKNLVVTYLGVPYQSLVDLNFGHTPVSSPTQWTTTINGGTGSDKWLLLVVDLQTLIFSYPLGGGRWLQSGNVNGYRLPAGWLRNAPQDPKAGSNSFIGAASNNPYSDWNPEGDYIMTADVGVILLRFVADICDVRTMDDLFCEGLGARIGLELCEPLTQSVSKKQAIASEYTKFMGEARLVNGIETGPVEPPLDDYLSCRA